MSALKDYLDTLPPIYRYAGEVESEIPFKLQLSKLQQSHVEVTLYNSGFVVVTEHYRPITKIIHPLNQEDYEHRKR